VLLRKEIEDFVTIAAIGSLRGLVAVARVAIVTRTVSLLASACLPSCKMSALHYCPNARGIRRCSSTGHTDMVCSVHHPMGLSAHHFDLSQTDLDAIADVKT